VGMGLIHGEEEEWLLSSRDTKNEIRHDRVMVQAMFYKLFLRFFLEIFWKL
jgi:hypothetical protein